LRISYYLESGPLPRINVDLIPYDQDFYVAEVNGAREFLIAIRAAQQLPDAIDLALTQTTE